MKYPKEYIEEIKTRLKVSTVVGRSINLKKRGKEFVGLSPFKNEKTPSFTVNDQKGFYHCFSSGEHGNIFDFLMKTQNFKFGEAVRKLASEAGMPIYKFTKFDEEKDKKWKIYSKILESYKLYYNKELKNQNNKELTSYLNKRGLSEKQIEDFKIGFVPNNPNFFGLLRKEYSEDEIMLSGLFYLDEKNNKYVERFRDRILFPINGLSGSTIAFGGRAISEKKLAKYINSPETLFFKKGNFLFNLDKARQLSFSKDEMFLVEGYMDVISLNKFGIKNVVANLGTALTENQIQSIWRFYSHVIICFDGDTGGVGAAVRAAERLISLTKPNQNISFLFLPNNDDPDTFIHKNGKEGFISYSEKKISIYDFIWNYHFKNTRTNEPQSVAELEKNLKNLSNKILDETTKKYTLEFFLKKLSFLTPFSNEKRNYFKKQSGAQHQPLDLTKKIFLKKKNYETFEIKEFSIFHLIINHLHIFQKKIELLSELNLYSQTSKDFLNALIEKISSKEIFDNESFKEKFKGTKYIEFINNINQMSAVKYIIKKTQDENQILSLYDEMANDLSKFEISNKIKILENKLIKDMNDKTYKELIDLKKLANNS